MDNDKDLLKNIQEELHEQVLAFRNIENYISSKDFAIVFHEYKDKDRVFKMIMAGNMDGIKNWFDYNKKLLPLDMWSVDMLRKEASVLKIPNYLAINKGGLLTILKRKRSC